MYWKTKKSNYVVLVATDKFSCWDKIKLDVYGTFDRSSSFLKFDQNGKLLAIYDGPVSTSDEDDFHITDIYFIQYSQLINAHFVNHDMTSEDSKCNILISDLFTCCENDLPGNIFHEIELFKTDPELFKTYKRRATLINSSYSHDY